MKRVLVLLVSFFVLVGVGNAQQISRAPINPDYFDYLLAPPSLRTDDGYGLGFIPPLVDLHHLTGIRLPVEERVGYPVYYDLRDLGRLTDIKDQGAYGTCWAFATYGSLESWLLTDEDAWWDFSENNLVNLHGFDWGFDAGGNHFLSTGYLARWGGPVSEADDPYPNPGGSIGDETVQKHVQQVFFLPDRGHSLDNDNIKDAVVEYGAVYTSMYWGGAYYNDVNQAYYYNLGGSSNHAVAIVGWDDGFAKEYFKSIPPGDGAFIVRNSWGDGWGEGGYFYISYYDSNIGKSNAVFNNAEEVLFKIQKCSV